MNLFLPAQEADGLDMPRSSGKYNHAVRLSAETYQKFVSVCGNISKAANQMRKHIKSNQDKKLEFW